MSNVTTAPVLSYYTHVTLLCPTPCVLPPPISLRSADVAIMTSKCTGQYFTQRQCLANTTAMSSLSFVLESYGFRMNVSLRYLYDFTIFPFSLYYSYLHVHFLKIKVSTLAFIATFFILCYVVIFSMHLQKCDQNVFSSAS